MASKKATTTKKVNGNKKEKGYFKVDDDRIMSIIANMEKKTGIEIDMVTCFEVKVTWHPSKYTKEEIQAMLK